MIKNFDGILPNIHEDTFIADNATVIGNVNIGEGSSIWFGAVLRGDIDNITIGKFSNIQDNSVLHTEAGVPTIIGDYTVIGHSAILHGCKIGDNCLIGMGAIILNNVIIGDNCIIGAGAVVTEGKIIPSNSLVLGIPSKVVREVNSEEIEATKINVLKYNERYKRYIE
ncbi:gamma carbonic anhydrase family protein [Schnuerera sp. xch1]|uniref:gamma carbonic anhydrase family protein n=1 Tax=Schnuerera sp. xch1 TaxID=2874283 RepID=UPI001CBC1403|nr:gamma carbonic anhydrase family protein [Schnuerera sp. xch1]MBZ2174143.1 gamma carbonic anhydrase family protein [Schnuerera sp. xch1]